MTETKSTCKIVKKRDSEKASKLSNKPPRKQQRKGENPTRIMSTPDQSSKFGHSNSRICKNSACKALLSIGGTFCRRCSCCVCHRFDDNKDPSLWLLCTSESPRGNSCGSSCHIECALQHDKVGVVDRGQLLQLDGSYCCTLCGKVTGIIGYWKKQLNIAKDARRVDVLCYRIYLSYRLLNGTSRFKELHEIVKDAKSKLETEVGPVNRVSPKIARGIVSRLSIANDVRRLCTLAIEKADKWLSTISNVDPEPREVSLPAACEFVFEEVTSSSVIIFLIEMSNASSENIQGYKLWYYKSKEEPPTKDPVCVFPRSQRKFLITHLRPCTEYTFQVISYTDTADLGYSEAVCFTESVDIFRKRGKKENHHTGGSSSGSQMEPKPTLADSGFKVQDLGTVLCLARAQEKASLEELCFADVKNCSEPSKMVSLETSAEEQSPTLSGGLDLNVVSVPDLNEELMHPSEPSKDEDDNCTLPEATDHDVTLQATEKAGSARSSDSGDSKTCTDEPTGEMPAVDSLADKCKKRAASTNEEIHDHDSILANGSPLLISDGLRSLDKNLEDCVKSICWLEREGHLKREFRLKFLTWFSLRSTEPERRVVNTFIQTLLDDPSSLAGQLVDSFSDIIKQEAQK